MARLAKIAPSILAGDLSCLLPQIRELEAAGISYLHIDVMDGHFVPNLTMGVPLVASLRRSTDLILDCHLMVEDPDTMVPWFLEAGADIVTVHWEAAGHIHRVLEHIRAAGRRAGVALNPATPIDVLYEILPYADLVLILTVNPGFSGQQFIPTMLDKVTRMRAMIDRVAPSVVLEVDGGINGENVASLVEAGADLIVAGAAVFGHPGGVGEAVRYLHERIGC
jgi:ribulose-phosphate 3-epimerase